MTKADPFAAINKALGCDSGPTSDFDLNPGIDLPPGRRLREAAVLVPFIDGPDGVELILTKRSSVLRHHPGQISFPGGKVDEDDASPEAAALREAWEEIGLDPKNVEILGVLPVHKTVTAFAMTPVVARVRAEFTPVPEPGEVAEVFRVPLSHVADPARYRVESRIWQGGPRKYYAAPFGPYYIWGATARVLRGFAERMSR
ncbi:CoA pyrophosphatase [Candidatus Halocynthiibacter alkanivorans]|uniref:CoA pyrophosphatase n=1 Tax=Candidatus Halocynthiibacter alkanivorans TaxID=2267619 RepID=UPI000DF2C90F|nr:CoA pyrophosphatase [Candidatus Halocynthiibacter alkanivorans]